MKIEEEKSKEELARENARLREQIRQLTIEKFKLEDSLYRAFRKCLNNKKRKIFELEKEVNKLRDYGGDTKCKRTKRDKPMVLTISDDDEDQEVEKNDGDSGSDTDLDEDTIHALNVERSKSTIISSKAETGDYKLNCNDKPKVSKVVSPLKKSTLIAADESESESSQEGLPFPFPKDFAIRGQMKKRNNSSPIDKESSEEVTSSPSNINKPPSESSNSPSPNVSTKEKTSDSQEQESQKYDLDELIEDL